MYHNCFSLIGWDEYLMEQGIIMTEKLKTFSGSNVNRFRYSTVLNSAGAAAAAASSPIKLYKSASLKYRRKVEDLPPLANRSAEKAKAVLIYQNGDVHFQGLHVTVTPKRFRNFDNLLTELTRITNLPQGARYIFTPTGGTRVESLDQLHNGGSYVCDSRPKLKKIDYTKIRARSKTVGGAGAMKYSNNLHNTNYNNTNFQTTYEEQVDIIKAKIITAVRNGITRPHVKVKLLLNKRTAHTLVQVLDDVTAAISADGCIRKLYTLQGKRIQKLAELFNDESVFIAVGTERFRSCDIPIIKDELGMNTTEYGNNYKPNQRATLQRKSYSLRCKPTKTKPKLESNGYEFSLLKLGKPLHPILTRRRNSEEIDTLKALDELPIVKQYNEEEQNVYLNDEEEQFLSNIPYLNDNIYIQNQHRSKIDRNIFDKPSMHAFEPLPPIIKKDIVLDVRCDESSSRLSSRKGAKKRRNELPLQCDDEQLLNDKYLNSSLQNESISSSNVDTIHDFMARSGELMNSNGVVANGNSQNDLQNSELGNCINAEYNDNRQYNKTIVKNLIDSALQTDEHVHQIDLLLLKSVEEKTNLDYKGLYIDTSSTFHDENANLKAMNSNEEVEANGVQLLSDYLKYENTLRQGCELDDKEEDKQLENEIEAKIIDVDNTTETNLNSVITSENNPIGQSTVLSGAVNEKHGFDGYESGDGTGCEDNSSNDSGIENNTNDDAEDSQGSFIKFGREGSTGESELPFDHTEPGNDMARNDSDEDDDKAHDMIEEVKGNEEKEINKGIRDDERELNGSAIDEDESENGSEKDESEEEEDEEVEDEVEVTEDQKSNGDEKEGIRSESGYGTDKNRSFVDEKEGDEDEEEEEDDEVDGGEKNEDEEDDAVKENQAVNENQNSSCNKFEEGQEEEEECENIETREIENSADPSTDTEEVQIDKNTNDNSDEKSNDDSDNSDADIRSRKSSSEIKEDDNDDDDADSQSDESSSDSDEDIVTFLNKLKREGEIEVKLDDIDRERSSNYNNGEEEAKKQQTADNEYEEEEEKEEEHRNEKIEDIPTQDNNSSDVDETTIKISQNGMRCHSSRPFSIDENEQRTNEMNGKSTSTPCDEGQTGGPIDEERCVPQVKKNNFDNDINDTNISHRNAEANSDMKNGDVVDNKDDDVFVVHESEVKSTERKVEQVLSGKERFIRENMQQIESPFKLAAANTQGNEIFTNDGIRAFYDIGDILGDGNFAVVREARDKKTKKHYALKIIDASKIEGKEVLLQNEITIQRECNHRNLVKLYHDFHSPSDIFLVMELVPDGDFFDYISDNVKLDEEEASMYIRDMCSGIDYLHEKGVVHRDIKPENLLVST